MNYKGKMNRVYALPKDDAKYKFTYPVAQFDHDEGNAFSGGFVYNGSVAALKGKYIFGDIVTGRVFYVDYKSLKLGIQTQIQELALQVAGKEIKFQEVTKNRKTDLRFGLGPKDELYIFTKTDGRIYKVAGLLSDKKAQGKYIFQLTIMKNCISIVVFLILLSCSSDNRESSKEENKTSTSSNNQVPENQIAVVPESPSPYINKMQDQMNTHFNSKIKLLNMTIIISLYIILL